MQSTTDQLGCNQRGRSISRIYAYVVGGNFIEFPIHSLNFAFAKCVYYKQDWLIIEHNSFLMEFFNGTNNEIFLAYLS
jgi:hypothetical protein